MLSIWMCQSRCTFAVRHATGSQRCSGSSSSSWRSRCSNQSRRLRASPRNGVFWLMTSTCSAMASFSSSSDANVRPAR